jgi:DNA-binding winged helix-turn-helix (wHTH) protein
MRAMTDQIVLAKEPDFTLGALTVSPARRQAVADDQAETLQPRVMQVLVALAARRGDVVSRDELMARCWGGFAVSDDAIHRCIARLRRLSESHGGFTLETVPRVGYRLVEAEVPSPARRVLNFAVRLFGR